VLLAGKTCQLNTGRIRQETLGAIPNNIRLFIEVLKHVDVFLTHCGMNSVNVAMNCGAPMVAMPFVNDQVSNAKQILELNIGKRVRSFPSSGRQLYKTVKEVCEDKQIQNQSKKIQDLLKNETSMDEVS